MHPFLRDACSAAVPRDYSPPRLSGPLGTFRPERLLRARIEGTPMRWPNLVARFEGWFAEAVTRNEPELAEQFATIVHAFAQAEGQGSRGLHILFDELELGEIAKLEVRELFQDRPVDLHDLAAEFADLFREIGLWPSDEPGCRELPPAYAQARRW